MSGCQIRSELASRSALSQSSNQRTNLGLTLQELSELPTARAALERALAIRDAAYGPDSPEVAITLTNLGLTQRQFNGQDASESLI